MLGASPTLFIQPATPKKDSLYTFPHLVGAWLGIDHKNDCSPSSPSFSIRLSTESPKDSGLRSTTELPRHTYIPVSIPEKQEYSTSFFIHTHLSTLVFIN